MKVIMALAIFFLVHPSMPSKPGVEFISNISGPRLDFNKSTPQIGKFS